jgi:hypothetical protein
MSLKYSHHDEEAFDRNLARKSIILGLIAAFGSLQWRAAADELGSPSNPNPGLKSGQIQPAAVGPKIVCDQPGYSFGEVWAGEKIEHTYVIRNTGTAPLLIPANGVRPSCGCTVAGKFDDKIEPGQEGRIPVALNTEHQRGQVAKQVTVESNDPITPRLVLTLSGSVKTAVSMDPPGGASWGAYRAGSPDAITVKLTNNLPEPWHLHLKAPTASQPSAFDVSLAETQEGKTADVVVKLKRPVQEGSSYIALTFETGFTRQPQVVIPASVYCPPGLQAIPPQIVGTSTPGEEFRATFQLVNNREGNMNIESVTPSDPAVRAEVLPPGPDANRRMIRVVLPAHFAPTTDHPPTLTIKTDRQDLAKDGALLVPIRVHPQTTQPAEARVAVRR